MKTNDTKKITWSELSTDDAVEGVVAHTVNLCMRGSVLPSRSMIE